MIKFELKCEICNSKFDSNYNIPKVLICGHTVCSKCVERMKEKNISRCPFDRKLIDFDEDKVANNYYILSLIDGSIKDNLNTQEEEKEEDLALIPKPVINTPGWKNTLDGFIRGDILYTIESNGFFYCTDLKTGEWWFLYLNQFWGKHFFQLPEKTKMFMIDQYGSFYQTFTKNYYTQIGKKNAWRNTSHLCVLNDKLYSIETSNKLYETNLENGKWKEIGAKKEVQAEEDSELELENENGEEENNPQDNNNENNPIGLENLEINTQNVQNTQANQITNSDNLLPSSSSNNSTPINLSFLDSIFLKINALRPNFLKSYTENLNENTKIKSNSEVYFDVKDSTLLISTNKSLLVANKVGELFLLNEKTGETQLLRNDFSRNIESYSSNTTHIYYVEKGGNVIYRHFFGEGDKESLQNHFVKSKSNEINIENVDIKTKRANSINSIRSINSLHSSNRKSSDNFIINTKFLDCEKFITLESDVSVSKIFVDDSRIVLTDKKGELITYDILTTNMKKYQCMFMLRNCHLSNTILVGDGDLLIIDPIRLSLNKLNILTGSEVIILHSLKFLSSIKFIFSSNSKIYFIDITGSLFYFIESEKKITQIGNSGLCKYVFEFAVHKNFLYTIENTTLYRTNLSDGSYVEVKNEYSSNYKFFFSDNVHLIFVNKEDEIFVVKPEDGLKLIKKVHLKDISQAGAICYFKNHIIYYNNQNKNIEGLCLEKLEGENKLMTNEMLEIQSKTENDTSQKNQIKILVHNFPEVSLFINNHDCLACILKEGVIYKLFC